MVSVPDSAPEALWQQCKSGLQRCADALLRRQAKPCAPCMCEQTWVCVQSQQEYYKAMKHALSEHEKATCQRQYRQDLNERRKPVRTDQRAYWKAKAAALEADLAANRLHSA